MQQLAPWCAATVVGVFSGCAAAALARRLFLAAAVTLLLELWNLPWSWSRAAFLNAPTTTVSCALARQVKHWERAELTYWMSLCCAKRATFRWMSKILQWNRGFVLERLTFDWPQCLLRFLGEMFWMYSCSFKAVTPAQIYEYLHLRAPTTSSLIYVALKSFSRYFKAFSSQSSPPLIYAM